MFYFGGGCNYFQVKLKDSLKENKYYYGEYYVNLTNNSDVACNNQSMLFTKNVVYVDTANSDTLLRTPQITNYGNPIIADTINWVKVSGIFKAQGGEQFLTLGNFRDLLNNTKRILFQTTGNGGAYYYADDVSVIPLDSFNLQADAGRDTTIHIGDSAFIGSLTNGIDSIKWQILNTNGTIDSIRPGFWVHPTINTCYVLIQTVNGFTSSDTVCVNVLPLPLHFLKYDLRFTNEHTSGPSQEGNIENRWTTANEVNVSHFYIQRSLNGKDFTTIGKLKANGASYNEYEFTDNQLPTTNDQLTLYYRIISIDKDGTPGYSDIKTINYKPQTVNGFSLYPNPVLLNSRINIECKGAKELLIIDYLGKEVFADKTNRNSYIIHLKSFIKGIYVVKVVTTNGEVKTQKLVVE